jgi:hypothetical protein
MSVSLTGRPRCGCRDQASPDPACHRFFHPFCITAICFGDLCFPINLNGQSRAIAFHLQSTPFTSYSSSNAQSEASEWLMWHIGGNPTEIKMGIEHGCKGTQARSAHAVGNLSGKMLAK